MTISKTISSLFISAIMILSFSGCASSDPGNNIQSLENTVNALKENVSTLQKSIAEMQSKNDVLESELKANLAPLEFPRQWRKGVGRTDCGNGCTIQRVGARRQSDLLRA